MENLGVLGEIPCAPCGKIKGHFVPVHTISLFCIKMKQRIQILSLLLVCLFMGSGCSRQLRPADMPKLYPCKITILDKDGNPLPNVLVAVSPENPCTEDPNSKWRASSSTDASGVADIKTIGKYRGLPTGQFRVTLGLFEEIKSKTLDADTGKEMEVVQSNNVMPMEYWLISKTPFRLEMEPKAMNFTFQLEK